MLMQACAPQPLAAVYTTLRWLNPCISLPALPPTDSYHGHAGLEEEYGIGGAIIIDDPRDPYR